MRWGISSWAFPWAIGVPGHTPTKPMTAFDLAARAAALEVEIVQIADNLPLDALSERDLVRLRQRGDELGIAFEVGTVGIEPTHLGRYRRIARTLGSPFVRTVVDTASHKPSAAEVIAALEGIMPGFEQDGIHLLIENHDRFPARSLKSIMEAVPSRCLGICLDTVNSLASLETVEVVLDVLRPWIENVHIKDFAVRREDHKMGFRVSGTSAGEGALDLVHLVEALRSLPTEPSVILELWPAPEGDLASAMAKEARWVTSSVRFLRGLLEGSARA
jgi:3-oxoisoapionate decarboxylase